MHKIVPRDQCKRTQAGWDLRPTCNSGVEVISVPIFANESLVYGGADGVIIRGDFVIVLRRQIQPHHRIPVHTSDVFLTKQRGILIDVQEFKPRFFRFALVFKTVAKLFFPLARGVEQPVSKAIITHLQALAESIVIYGRVSSHRHWRYWVSPTLWVAWRKWRHIWSGIRGQESGVTFPVV